MAVVICAFVLELLTRSFCFIGDDTPHKMRVSTPEVGHQLVQILLWNQKKILLSQTLYTVMSILVMSIYVSIVELNEQYGLFLLRVNSLKTFSWDEVSVLVFLSPLNRSYSYKAAWHVILFSVSNRCPSSYPWPPICIIKLLPYYARWSHFHSFPITKCKPVPHLNFFS